MDKLTITAILVIATLGPLAGYGVGYSRGHEQGKVDGGNDEGRKLSETLSSMARYGHLVSAQPAK